MLNIGSRKVSTSLLIFISFIGFGLQAGVVILAGFTSKHKYFTSQIPDDDYRMPPRVSFPIMTVGTVFLGLGMYLSAVIVNRSTIEETYELSTEHDSPNLDWRVGWIQKAGNVGDQHFGSYLIRRRPPSPPTSVLEKAWNFLSRYLTVDTRFEVQASRKVKGLHQHQLTIMAVFFSLSGFIVQFTGLRGLNWTVSVAQLGVIGIMCGLRAMIRSNLAVRVVEDDNLRTSWGIDGRSPKHHDYSDTSRSGGTHFLRLREGYELEEVAQELSGCAMMVVVISDEVFDEDCRDASSAEAVVQMRCRMSEFAVSWENEWRKSSCRRIVKSIEDIVNMLHLSTESQPKRKDFGEIKCHIKVEHARDRNSKFPRRGAIQVKIQRYRPSRYEHQMPWKVCKTSTIEAILGLWLLYIEPESSLRPRRGIAYNNYILRIIHMGRDLTFSEAIKLLHYWLPRGHDIIYHLSKGHWIFGDSRSQTVLNDPKHKGPVIGSHTASYTPSSALGYRLCGSSVRSQCELFLILSLIHI